MKLLPRRVLVVFLLLLVCTSPSGHAALNGNRGDADSGRDAPDSLSDEIFIEYGRTYQGFGDHLSDEDWFVFSGTRGDVVDVRLSANPFGWYGIYDEFGSELDTSFSMQAEIYSARAYLPASGNYFLHVYTPQAERPAVDSPAYRFGIQANGEAPAPGPFPIDPLLSTASDPDGPPELEAATVSDEHVVVAVIDTGINPYHGFFHAPALSAHPSEWLEGFSENAVTFPLSTDEPSYEEALIADEAAWSSVEQSSYDRASDSFETHLYTFPGTRIVGAVSFGSPARPLLLDTEGHGTQTAGLALGSDLASGSANVLLVAIQAGGALADAVRWAARQSYIDVISVSIGTVGGLPAEEATVGSGGVEWTRAEASREAAEAGKAVFTSSGNGAASDKSSPVRCSTYTSASKGSPWVIRMGAAYPDGDVAWWHCVPVEAVARTDVYTPMMGSLNGFLRFTGTSAAAPNGAGQLAQLLLELRQRHIRMTPSQAVPHLLQAASSTKTSVGYARTLSTAPLAERGYGLIDDQARNKALSRVIAGLGPTPRPDAESWFEIDRLIRTTLWG